MVSLNYHRSRNCGVLFRGLQIMNLTLRTIDELVFNAQLGVPNAGSSGWCLPVSWKWVSLLQ